MLNKGLTDVIIYSSSAHEHISMGQGWYVPMKALASK